MGERLCAQGTGEAWEPQCSAALPPSQSQKKSHQASYEASKAFLNPTLRHHVSLRALSDTRPAWPRTEPQLQSRCPRGRALRSQGHGGTEDQKAPGWSPVPAAARRLREPDPPKLPSSTFL
uniref:Uncharacterized protein n=1 Tax=Rangifer tarandus platyrhynchus TaxID=3082113 RepID=A0ACB0ENV7_RANTA|nr:unnamed protein product [Rangifer tarandus platyrhynchus]